MERKTIKKRRLIMRKLTSVEEMEAKLIKLNSELGELKKIKKLTSEQQAERRLKQAEAARLKNQIEGTALAERERRAKAKVAETEAKARAHRLIQMGGAVESALDKKSDERLRKAMIMLLKMPEVMTLLRRCWNEVGTEAENETRQNDEAQTADAATTETHPDEYQQMAVTTSDPQN
jgi:formamidopyrimidine-DNA glycosylase